MIWIQFAVSAAIIISAAIKLSRYGDAIAHHTKLGGLFIGSFLLAAATSLPELLTMINAIKQDHINLTAGDLFGSSMFNMLLLGILDLLFYKTRILRRVALRHALTASLATMLTAMAVFFLLYNLHLKVGWVGVDSLIMITIYVGGVWLLRFNPVIGQRDAAIPSDEPRKLPTFRRASIGFIVTAIILIMVTPWMVRSGAGIAQITGLGDGFVGMVLIAAVTSLPEMVATISAARLGAYDMAVGNLFGSNAFNMFALGLADVIYLEGRFLGAIDPIFALAGLLAMMITLLGLIGNLVQVERRIWILELDALFLILSYLGGMYLLYLRGIG